MNWMDIADVVTSIIGGIIVLPFLFGILILLLGATLYCFEIVIVVVDYVLRLFNVNISLKQFVEKILIQFVDFIFLIPSFLKRLWKATKIIIAILFILTIWLTPFLLNHCGTSHNSDDNGDEDEYFEPGKLRPDRF